LTFSIGIVRIADVRTRIPRTTLRISAALIFCLVSVTASSQFRNGSILPDPEPAQEFHPDSEFRMARVKYRTFGGAGSHGLLEPWWAIDYPFAEEHFLAALRRTTNLTVSDVEAQLELTDKRIFEYPFLFLQAPGAGNWQPTMEEADSLHEYLQRGGFLLIDDFHGERDWAIVQSAIEKVFPDRLIVEIPETDPLMHVFYDLDERSPIPGERHLRMGPGGQIVAQMQGPSHWRGIYDDHDRLMVAMNFNIDMGDSWEHADDPRYPVPMTALGYKFGINYVIYSMTH
jgi:hypothetical protein